MSPMDQAAECQDSTCAQVIRSNAETSGVKRMHICISSGDHEQKQPALQENLRFSTVFEKLSQTETVFGKPSLFEFETVF